MNSAAAIITSLLIGVVFGLAGSTPLFVMLRRAVAAKQNGGEAPSIQAGFGAVVLSAVIIMVEIALAYKFLPATFLIISVTAVLTMLVAVSISGLAAWHALEATRRNH